MKFLENIPSYLFFTGKGGVGKTSISCATAIRLAELGKRVLLVSTDPASNVGQVFDQTIGNTMGISVRALLRKNVEPYEELGLAEDKFTDDQLIDFMLQHPILINRPIVVTPLGTKLCRPSEVVLDILPDAQKAAFTKEDGEKVVDDSGKRLK